MKSAFVTCVKLGLACMEEIYRVGGTLDLVVTLRDDIGSGKSGRVYVDDFCQSNGIPLLKIRSVNDDEVIQLVRNQEIDWLFIIGWSQIAKPALLSAPRLGCIGIHPTLLPQGRGRAPIPWAILNGLTETGVTLFKLDAGVDTGPIVAQIVVPMSPDETATTLYDRVMDAHRILIGKAWPSFQNGTVTLTPQDSTKASVWPKRTPSVGEIRDTMSVAQVDRLVRATTRPYPGAFYDDRLRGHGIRVWSGQAGGTAGRVNPDVYAISVSDGVYWAVEYDAEPLAPGAPAS